MKLLRDVNTRVVRTELDHEDAEGLALVWREDGNAGKIVVVVGDLLFGEVANGVILLRLAVRSDVEEDWEARRKDAFGKRCQCSQLSKSKKTVLMSMNSLPKRARFWQYIYANMNERPRCFWIRAHLFLRTIDFPYRMCTALVYAASRGVEHGALPLIQWPSA